MNGGFPEGEDPDPDDSDDSGPAEPELDRIRGWLPPDDRLWRHPSEMGGSQRPAMSADPPAPGIDRGRSGQWVASTAAVCVVGALLVGGLLMATTGASPTDAPVHTATTTAAEFASPTTEAGGSGTITRRRIAQTVSGIRPSMVALTVTVAGRSVDSTGVTVGTGGMVVAVASALSGATSVTTIDAEGQRSTAAVLASDPSSNLAVLHVGSDLPVAHFGDGSHLAPGDAAVAVAPEPRPRQGHVADAVYAGTVQSSGTAVNADATTTAMSATAVNAPLGQGDAGCALINRSGDVAGIMDTTTTMQGRRVSVFLPADLVVGVARQLMATGSVRHGWLGVDASDFTASTSPGATSAPGTSSVSGRPAGSGAPTSGALVDTVQPGGAAARAGIQVGDSIVDIDGRPVRSLADLRTRLYAEPPGTNLAVTYARGGATATVGVVLSGASPAG